MRETRSTIGGGAGSKKCVPVLGGDGTKIAPTGDIFGQPPGEMSSVRGKLADHVGDHIVLYPEGAVLVTSTGTESSYPRPPQSLNTSRAPSRLCARLCVCVCMCVYVCVRVCVGVFIKLHITAQSGPVILVILCHSH